MAQKGCDHSDYLFGGKLSPEVVGYRPKELSKRVVILVTWSPGRCGLPTGGCVEAAEGCAKDTGRGNSLSDGVPKAPPRAALGGLGGDVSIF